MQLNVTPKLGMFFLEIFPSTFDFSGSIQTLKKKKLDILNIFTFYRTRLLLYIAQVSKIPVNKLKTL